jgi:hypothetical protein
MMCVWGADVCVANVRRGIEWMASTDGDHYCWAFGPGHPRRERISRFCVIDHIRSHDRAKYHLDGLLLQYAGDEDLVIDCA